MRRQFKLDEMGVEKFQVHWEEHGKPPKQFHDQGRNPARFFSIQNLTGYGSFDELLGSIEDDFQTPRCLWFPRGDVSIGVATHRTIQNDEKYFAKLREQSEDDRLRTLVVQMSSDLRSNLHSDDFFNFRRDNGFWYVDYFNINRNNFRMYCFENIERLYKSVPVIYGIRPMNAYASV
jgi:hypothetical protein